MVEPETRSLVSVLRSPVAPLRPAGSDPRVGDGLV